MKTQISIIGCGWLGLPLAKTLINNGHTIKGATTNSKLTLLKSLKIKPFKICLKENEIEGNYSDFLAESETLIINIPPGLRKNPNKNHVAEISHLLSAVANSSIKNILYISSTSVFENEFHFPKITEASIPNAKSNGPKQLISIEKMLQNNTSINTTILRFGGLFDAQRHPGNFLSGKQNIKNPEAPINLIHKTDCITIISKLLQENIWNITLNAVFPLHTKKADYYVNHCKIKYLPIPNFNNTQKSKGKIIDSSKLVQLLNYSFVHKP